MFSTRSTSAEPLFGGPAPRSWQEEALGQAAQPGFAHRRRFSSGLAPRQVAVTAVRLRRGWQARRDHLVSDWFEILKQQNKHCVCVAQLCSVILTAWALHVCPQAAEEVLPHDIHVKTIFQAEVSRQRRRCCGCLARQSDPCPPRCRL